MDTYLTLSASGEAIYTEKRSKFYAFAEHVDDEESAKARVAALRKQFYDARHVCFAYALDFDGERTRTNDDGEPSGTAGRPILGALRSAGLTFALVVVVGPIARGSSLRRRRCGDAFHQRRGRRNHSSRLLGRRNHAHRRYPDVTACSLARTSRQNPIAALSRRDGQRITP